MGFRKLIFRMLYGSRYPVTSGSLHIPTLRQDITVRRDEHGIVYIEAKNDQDAWFGLGFCHGQDRAYQIENYVRIVRGTLAELIGEPGVVVDRLSRRIGFYRSANEQLSLLDNDVRATLEAYAQGVNSGIELGCPKPAHEFTLTGIKPTEFTAADALGLFKFMSFGLASNWDVELARLMILKEEGPEAVEALDPTYPYWLRVTSPPTELAGQAQRRLSEDLSVLLKTTGWRGGGSNCWAVSPGRTISGRAILANDPHLAPVMPPHWYLARISTPDWAVAGCSFVGTPCFPTGHNGHIAWGITAGLLDNTDLYIEEMSPDGHSVRLGKVFVQCETRIETIQIRGSPPIEEEVLTTSRGPIIGPALDGELVAISLQATWLEPRPISGLYQIHRAKSFEELRRCFHQWPLLPLNMLYADNNGMIGWQLTGETPKRRKGWGMIPLPGSDPETGWEVVPVGFEDMPFLQDPEAGFVASANNKPTVPDGEPFLGEDWTDGYRITRISELLEEINTWDVVKMQKMQVDQFSIPWRDMREVILSAPAKSDQAERALTILKDWDGRVATDSIGASVFEFLLDELIQRLAKAKAPHSAEFALGKCFTPLAPNSMFIGRRVGHLVHLLKKQPDGWFKGSWNEELDESLSKAISRLQEKYGPDSSKWAWGSIRSLTLIHPEGGRALWGPIFNLGPLSWGGDINTISQAEFISGDPTSNPTSFASLRAVYDAGNWEACRFALPGGQSGNPLSPNYSDQFPIWQRSEGVPIAWSKENIEKITESKLVLSADKT